MINNLIKIGGNKFIYKIAKIYKNYIKCQNKSTLMKY